LRITSEMPDDYYKWFYEVVPGVDPLATCNDRIEDGLQWQVVVFQLIAYEIDFYCILICSSPLFLCSNT
jgi:hypothetical protein